MPIDAYSPCPGGTGKKIKFCCPDLHSELDKIVRMLEGDQHLGGLQYIEQLQQEHPDRACLWAIKIMLLHTLARPEEVQSAVATFIEKHPDNPIAMAEAAVQAAADHNGPEAIRILQRALTVSAGQLQRQVYEAIGAVAEVLLDEGEWSAARALLQLQMLITKDDPRPMELLIEMNRASGIPLLFKDDPPVATCPDDAPWKDRFTEAMTSLQRGNWEEAAERLAALAAEIDDAPAIWRNLATLRGWLADKPGHIEALQKLATLDIPLEDAVEAEALAMLTSPDPLGDPLDMVRVTCTIKDFEQLQAALSLERQAVKAPFDLSMFASEDSLPPKAAYLLFDRPIGETAENATLESVSRFLGQAMIFSRQTDREPRLELIGVASTDLEPVKELLGKIAGDALEGDAKEEVMAQVSASRELLQRKWRLPHDTTPQQTEALALDYQRDALLNCWPQLKLAIFDGKSAREAARQHDYRIKLLAAVMVLELWNESTPGDFDFDELRSELGLPTPEPIDPQQVDPARLPLVRLPRVMIEKTSDETLINVFRRTTAFDVTKALRQCAQAVIDRPSLAGREEQLRAHRVLARIEEDPAKGLKHVEQGRAAALSAEQSCAAWDLLELHFRAALGEGREIQRVVQHIQAQHMEEPGVGEALMQFLVQIGVLQPDGSPAAAPQAAAPMAAAAPQPDKIWTPGSDEPGTEKKLWTPD